MQKLREHNHRRCKVSVMGLNAFNAAQESSAWATCFVHRGTSYCEIYSGISGASVRRVQRAQSAILAGVQESK